MKWFAIIYGILYVLFMIGCQVVTIRERVVYEDETPVRHTKVRQWNDTYSGITFTDKDGVWFLDVPADQSINLCIENPRNNYNEACYNGLLLTPTENGEMEKVE